MARKNSLLIHSLSGVKKYHDYLPQVLDWITKCGLCFMKIVQPFNDVRISTRDQSTLMDKESVATDDESTLTDKESTLTGGESASTGDDCKPTEKKFSGVISASIGCDMCGMRPITGEIYHCQECVDIDMCKVCSTIKFEGEIIIGKSIHKASHKLELINPRSSFALERVDNVNLETALGRLLTANLFHK